MQNILVLFGGKSTEHEISVISGIQVLHALDKEKYSPIPVYVSKTGDWILGDKSFYDPKTFQNLEALEKRPKVLLPADMNSHYLLEQPSAFTLLRSLIKDHIDVIFPVFHGRYGEDGAMQGLFELSGIPYVGCDVTTSAVSMDKVLSKIVAASAGVPVLPHTWANKSEWMKNKKETTKRLLQGLSFPVFVKPVHLGSTIAVSKAKNQKEFESALEVGFYYDTKVMVEQGLAPAREVNVSILGNQEEYRFSACEEPLRTGEILSFEDKYIASDGGSKGMATAKRVVPAKIKASTQTAIFSYTEAFFREINGDGLSRLDFLISPDEKKIYFNEINPMPGSVAFYLWKEVGMSFTKLTTKLIELAIERHKRVSKLQTIFSSNALSGFSNGKAGGKLKV